MSYSKYYLWKKQVSYDSGVTWVDVTPTETTPSGDPIATYATLEECQGIVPPTPTPQYRWTDSGWTCSGTSGYDKYNLQVKEVSYDSGATWSAVTPTETQLGTLIEADSPDCGYVPPSYSAQYLTLIASDDITVTFTSDNGNVLSYSKDSGQTWTQANSIAMDAGDEVILKGTMTPSYGGIGTFSSNGSFEAIGNPMSLLFGDNFSRQTSLSGNDYAFAHLFQNCTYLQSIGNLVLPATTLASDCYEVMFKGCTSLTTVPSDLLTAATTLAESCYNNMFYGCSSLTSIPSGFLPATTLADMCYGFMFNNCTSLTAIPSDLLPATTLAESCYNNMFGGCTSLTSIPSDLLLATTLAQGCYGNMFYGCTSLTAIPSGLLPATTLAEECYGGMFYGCTSLTAIPSGLLPATTLADSCYIEMFSGCTALTTAPDLPATTLVSWCYNGMFIGCTNLNYIKCLATNINAYDYTDNWVRGVAASGTFVKNASTTGWTSGDSGIPNGWTVQDAS